MPQSAAALPDRFRDVEHLEDVMTTPSAALTAELRELPGDLIILGVAGKIGPTLARLAKRAAPGKRIVGVSSGASAPEELVQRLVAFFRERGVSDVSEFEMIKEDVRFMLPKKIRQAVADAAP